MRNPVAQRFAALCVRLQRGVASHPLYRPDGILYSGMLAAMLPGELFVEPQKRVVVTSGEKEAGEVTD